MQSIQRHIIDLTKIAEEADIKCLKCGTIISPDDETEDSYKILETVLKEGSLDKVIVKCNKCQTEICLAGFQILDE